MFFVIVSMFAEKGSVRIPELSEVLQSFSLPAMAEALEVEEKNAKAQAMIDQLKAVAAKTGGKVEIK